MRVNEGEEAHGPQILPGGRHVLFTLRERHRERQMGSRAHRRAVARRRDAGPSWWTVGATPATSPTGHLVYALSGVLYAVPFDAARLALTGPAVAIVEGVSRATGGQTGAAHYGVSETGTLVYIPGPVDASAGLSETMQLGLIDRKGVIERLPLPPDTYQTPRVSPDGTRLAFGTDDGKEAIVWVYDLSGNVPRRRLTFGGNNRFPVWSADGKRDRRFNPTATATRQSSGRRATEAALPSVSPRPLTVRHTCLSPGRRMVTGCSTASRRKGERRPVDAARVRDRARRRHLVRFARRRRLPRRSHPTDAGWRTRAPREESRRSTCSRSPRPERSTNWWRKALDTPEPSGVVTRWKELFYNPRPLGLEVVAHLDHADVCIRQLRAGSEAVSAVAARAAEGVRHHAGR